MNDLPLTASYFTLTGAPPGQPPRFPLAERAAAAVAAGFGGIALAPDELRIARAAGLGAADLRGTLDEIGIVVTDLEPLRGWDGEEGAREDEEAMYELADACGATRLTAIQVVGDEVAPEDVAERFAALCDRAAEHGVTVVFEPRASSPIEDPAGAAALLERAGRPNVAIAVDHYHAHRGGWGVEEVVAAGIPVAAIHLNDTTAVPLDSPLADALENRLAPGEGDLDVAAFIASLKAAGIDAPYAVEVLSAAARELPLAEAATRAATGARTALAAA
jgi:sugar phosphate isomerase/epimerase